MTHSSSPELSVIVVTPDCYETIRRTVEHLRAQSVTDQLELVIVAPEADTVEADDLALATFDSFQVVDVTEAGSMAQAYAAGVRQARSPVVAFVEEHSYPEPGWAEALIRAHREPWASVGPVVRIANADSAVGWADFLIAYGRWMNPSNAGVRDFLPEHNSSYKRDVLLQYGSTLETMMDPETILHWDLRAKGYELYQEPAARIDHLCFGLLSSWLRVQFHTGRIFATGRARRWSAPRRLLYTAGSPLIPVVRFRRIVAQPYGQQRPRDLPRGALPALVILGLVAGALGEMLGYSLGPGDSGARMHDLHFHRSRHLSKRGSRETPATAH